MQLKNNNPVPMEKRTDLASLFCMIGRHGPAVAVAVIAMVSVVAGFIIYRTVKGKRRKAEAGPGDVGSSSCHGALREELLQPEQEAPSPVESTDASGTVSNAKDAPVIRSRRKLKNRASAERNSQSSTPPKGEVEQAKQCNASHVEETSSIPQKDMAEAMERLQDNTSEVMDFNVKNEGSYCNLVKTTNDAEDDCSDFLVPGVVCESLGNEKVKSSKEDEVSTDVLTEMACKERKNECALNSPVCQVENASASLNEEQSAQATMESINHGSFSEEPSIHLNDSIQSTKNEDEISVLDIAGLNKPHLVNKDFENVTLHKHMDDQLMTLTNQAALAIPGVDVDQSQSGEITENQLDNLGDMSSHCPVMLLGKEQEASTCSKENVEYNEQSSLVEPTKTSVVFHPVQPCLTVEQKTTQNDHASTQVNLLPEDKIKETVTPELAKETSDALLDIACQSEGETAIDIGIPKENESSADEPNAVDISSDASVSTLICPDKSSFQNQENVQVLNTEDHVEVPTVPILVMAEAMEPQIEDQLLYENSSNLTLCSLDVGEESGISSMTVSPDFPDAGEFLANENVLPVLDANPKSEDQAELNSTAMTDSQSVINKEPTNLVSESSNNSQPFNDDIESFNKTVDKPVDAPTSFCLNEDMGKMSTKIFKSKCEEEVKEEDKTEINIMEATMDNNEWLTDGTDQVLPWIKHSVPQINIVSEHFQTCSVDAACTNADVPPISESEEANMNPSTDEATEAGKRVLAVQPLPQNVSVTFQIHYLTHSPYHKVAITGNHCELGNWKDFVPLEEAKDGFWATVVSLPAESHVEWKFVIVDRGQVFRWEECGNRLLDTGNRENLLVHKYWGFL